MDDSKLNVHGDLLMEIDPLLLDGETKKATQQISLVFTSCQFSHQLRNIVHAGVNVFLCDYVTS